MPKPAQPPRFEELTETTGIPLTPEGASMMYTRYWYAAQLAEGRTVLELGCGAGQGFGLLSATAGSVIGGDVSLPLLRAGRSHYQDRFPLVQLSAESLPFRDQSVSLVLFFEASYYVLDMRSAFAEIARVLTPDGISLFVNANPQREDFIRSPRSAHYHTADEFRSEFNAVGMTATVCGAFEVEPGGTGLLNQLVDKVVPIGRRILEGLGLVPKTLQGRARLKRLLYRRLACVPAELRTDFAPVSPRIPVQTGPVNGYKVIYVTAEKKP